MNWYKKAQKIPTMENITWAIDKLIAENYEFTVEELSQSSQPYALPKAAQVKARKKPRRGIAPKLENVSRSNTSQVFDLFERGTSTQDISKQLGIPAVDIANLLRIRFPKKTDRDEYLKKKYEENILNTTEEMSQKMMNNFNVPAFGTKDIASVLNVDPKYISKTLKQHNINLNHFVTKRRDVMVEKIEQIVKELPSKFTVRDLQKEFKKRYNFILNDTSAYSAMKLNNLGEKNKNDPDTIFRAFTTYMDRMVKGGRKIFQEQPEKLPIYIDRFFQDYGEKHGFIPPYEQETLKKMFLTKIQMRENTINMEKYKYTPVDYSENNPATFLSDRDQWQNELV